MIRGPRHILTAGLLAALFFVTACDDAESRAEKHYQSGVELLAAGDVDRAVVEFRNVFKLNPNHADARIAFGRLYASEGNYPAAMREILVASEVRPEDADLHLEAASLALETGKWDVAQRQVDLASKTSPDAPLTHTVQAALAYRNAIEAKDDPARRDAARDLADASGTLETPVMAWQFMLDSAIRDGEFPKALDLADKLIAARPKDSRWREIRLGILNQMGEGDQVQAELEKMIELFPDREDYSAALIQYFLRQGHPDEAEKVIRARIATAKDPDAQRALLVAFLRQTKGVDAALAELETMIAEAQKPDLFRAMRAGLKFDMGQTDVAVSEMEAILADAEESPDTHNIKVALAKMLQSTGNDVAARQRVEEVLASDPTNVAATKMRAGWLIREDKPTEAILVLRGALDQAPNDPEIMMLMAEAHLRDGSRGLAGEMLALAVEAAQKRPAESLAYAQFLITDKNYATAETILIDSLRVAPNNVELLQVLGNLYITTEDWPRAEQVEATLRRLDTEVATSIADNLRLARLQAQNRGDEALAYLESLTTEGDSADAARVAIARMQIENGDFAGAESYLDSELAKAPDSPTLRFLLANVYLNTDRRSEADKVFRDLLAEDDQREGVWRALYTVALRNGDIEGASNILDEALTAIPESPNLAWARAGEYERAGKIDDAIAIYEDLYAKLPNSPIIANNLASMIATYGGEDADLDRAMAVAKRLKESNVPAFQDTYGWIAFRQGLMDEALAHLEPAAQGLPDDPIVQFHLAEVYARLERPEDALAQYRKAVDVAGPADTRPQIEAARTAVQTLAPSGEPAPSAAPGAGADAEAQPQTPDTLPDAAAQPSGQTTGGTGN